MEKWWCQHAPGECALHVTWWLGAAVRGSSAKHSAQGIFGVTEKCFNSF
jgi:hypothetical protein